MWGAAMADNPRLTSLLSQTGHELALSASAMGRSSSKLWLHCWQVYSYSGICIYLATYNSKMVSLQLAVYHRMSETPWLWHIPLQGWRLRQLVRPANLELVEIAGDHHLGEEFGCFFVNLAFAIAAGNMGEKQLADAGFPGHHGGLFGC